MAQTPEERRAKARERMRKKRAAERAAREAEKAAAANAANAEAPKTMRDAVMAALAAMKWLVPSDDASVAQAKLLAEQVDLMTHAGDVAKALSAHRALTTVLDHLGGTPTVRLQHELRSLKLAAKSGDDDNGGNDETEAGNVSKFERPAKRKAAGR